MYFLTIYGYKIFRIVSLNSLKIVRKYLLRNIYEKYIRLLTLFLKLRISKVGQLVLENIKDKSKINVGL